MGEEHALFRAQFEFLGRVLPVAVMKPRGQSLRSREQEHVRGNETGADVIIGFLNLRITDAPVRLPRTLIIATEIGDVKEVHRSRGSGSPPGPGAKVARDDRSQPVRNRLITVNAFSSGNIKIDLL